MSDIDKVILVLMKKKKSVGKEISDTAAYYHGWNAAIDELIQVVKGLR